MAAMNFAQEMSTKKIAYFKEPIAHNQHPNQLWKSLAFPRMEKTFSEALCC